MPLKPKSESKGLFSKARGRVIKKIKTGMTADKPQKPKSESKGLFSKGRSRIIKKIKKG